jgi:RNA polymerase sigma-70 factor (ECF subfamily)
MVEVASRAVASIVDDAALVEQARAGDDRSFATLYHRHARYIAGVVHKLMGDDEELDDLVQQTFIDVSDGLGALREPAAFRFWVTRIAVRRVQHVLIQRRRFRWFKEALGKSLPKTSEPADRDAIRALDETLDRMPPKLRVPWILHEMEGLALEEVARACDVSLATVKRRIAEADLRVKRGVHAK